MEGNAEPEPTVALPRREISEFRPLGRKVDNSTETSQQAVVEGSPVCRVLMLVRRREMKDVADYNRKTLTSTAVKQPDGAVWTLMLMACIWRYCKGRTV